ncbi:MAG: hypothetical protein HKN21_05370, partial [Candidatus Eisenbacteria bacterium]|nr:hypothetical protein [Candidatus Eisenbacteria bacterium]
MPDVSKTKRSLSLKAPAKLNLGLEVVRKRPDGFHDIRTIFQAIHLYDFLTLSPNPRGAIELEVTGPVSVDGKLEDNLVTRAALRLQ